MIGRRREMDLPMPSRLAGVTYEVRGRLYDEAQRLERSGRPVLDLSLGNPASYGFQAPEEVLAAVADRLGSAAGYTPTRGRVATREAVAAYAAARGIPVAGSDEVFLGNGVSDLILLSLQALLEAGDEVLVPVPDYPVWTAAVALAGGVAVGYPCEERSGWLPDVEALQALVTPRTKALVVINPNNPTGAVYPRALVEMLMDVARRHHLVVMSDEIYDQVVYDGFVHTPAASCAPDVVCLTFNGLSKAYLLTGFRSGWLVVTGPRRRSQSLVAGLDLLLAMRLGANAPGQIALEVALDGRHGPASLLVPGGRLREQRDVAVAALCQVPGVTCTRPGGGFYLFPRFDPFLWRASDDEQLMLDVLRGHRVLFTPGRAFHWRQPDHFRLVTLATPAQLRHAAEALCDHFDSRHRLGREFGAGRAQLASA